MQTYTIHIDELQAHTNWTRNKWTGKRFSDVINLKIQLCFCVLWCCGASAGITACMFCACNHYGITNGRSGSMYHTENRIKIPSDTWLHKNYVVAFDLLASTKLWMDSFFPFVWVLVFVFDLHWCQKPFRLCLHLNMLFSISGYKSGIHFFDFTMPEIYCTKVVYLQIKCAKC